MKNLEFIHLKTKKMLENFGQKNINPHFISFVNKKVGIQERKELRQKLINQIKNHTDFKKYEKDFEEESLLKVGKKPHCSFASISISHCDHLGAFLFVFDKNISIGLDIEEKKRITQKNVERISSKEEMNQAPHYSLLWVAKEASFKSLFKSKTLFLLSDCLISNWKIDPVKDIYFFNSYSKTTGERAFGTACFIDELAVTYAEMKLV